MSRFLALIMAVAMALFIAGPAMAAVTVTKTVDNSNDADTTFSTDVTVTKDVDISVDGNLDATGGIDVQGDVVFKELDVNVQDQENVVKFFELDDSASSTWSTSGTGFMAAAEQLQNGLDNTATITQHNNFNKDAGMHVGLQYQVGNANTADLLQTVCHHEMNNFAKQIQIGNSNTATGTQD